MRNVRNKINTVKCLTGLKATPAGIVFDYFGYMDNEEVSYK